MERRTYVVSGAGSGIGLATAQLLGIRGHRVIGIDLRGADIVADLATVVGRSVAIEQVNALSGGLVNALVLAAGSSARVPATVSVNFFGAVDLLMTLRPLLACAAEPRAVVVSSEAALMQTDEVLIDACLRGDEEGARSRAAGMDVQVYTSSKAALIRWCRRQSVTPEWAGAGILLNVVAPGIVDTPMMQATLQDPERTKAITAQLPVPLGRVGRPLDVAQLLAFLASAENSLMLGQVLYVDSGSEATNRGELIW